MHVGTVIADRFRIEQRAGRGGMGAVYRARDLARDVDVAIKVSHLAGRDEARRMAREAQALAGHLMELHHPHIVEYVAHGVIAEDQMYLVMEWLEGHDLAKQLAQGPLAEVDVLALAWRLARTLSLVHGCGIVHRDIKPGNVFLVNGDLAAPKLIDFGLVLMDAELSRVTPSGLYLGTPGFMAPEQVREPRAVDGRADLYALGVLMFACLTQRLPFEGAHLVSVLARVLFEEAPRVRELRAEVSPALDELIARLLAKIPADRPVSADALATELERLLDSARAGEGSPLPARIAVSQGEQRFFTVLLAGPVAPATIETMAAALTSMTADQQVEVVRLTDRTLLAMFTGDGTLEDTAARAARGALSLRASGLTVPMVLATGRGSMSTRLPVGEAVERAAALRFGPAQGVAHQANVLFDITGHIVAAEADTRTLHAAAATTVPMAEGADAGILTDEVTARLLEKRFAIEPNTGPGFLLKGELTGSPGGRMPARPPGPWLGRERELTRLELLLDECIESSAPRAMLVGGPAGMGKSRLAEEFVHRLDARAQVWRAGGDPAHVGSSLGLLARLILNAAGALHAASPSEQGEVLASRVRTRVSAPKPEDVSRVVVFMSEIAGLPHGGEEDLQLREARRDARLMHDQMLRAWEDWLDAETAAGPVVLVLDDLQWADAPSLRFIERALGHLEDRPIFVMGLARPEIDETHPGLWSPCHPDRMTLRPLPRQACAALAQHHAARALNPDSVARMVERADGNPFYVEELARHASSGDRTAVPDTLLALVGMRLAALPAEERRVLRAASVFGRHFVPEGVAALLGEGAWAGDAVNAAIEGLIARDLVLSERHARGTVENAYRFRHDLVCEAAYAMLLEEDRVRAHFQAAVWLEQAGERDAYALAEHYRRGQAPAQALPWFCRAAEQALAADDLQAALDRVQAAIACGASGETLGTLRLLQAEAHNWSAQYQAAHESASAAMEHVPRGSDAWALAAHQRSWACLEIGDSEGVTRVAEQILACIATPLSDAFQVAVARCATHLVRVEHHRHVRQLLTHLKEAQPQRRLPSTEATLWHLRAMLAGIDGRSATAATCFIQAIEQWDIAGNTRQACLDLVNLGNNLRELGQYEESAKVTRRSLEQVTRLNIVHAIDSNSIILALALARLGQMDEAEQLIESLSSDTIQQRMRNCLGRALFALYASRPADGLDEANQLLMLVDRNPELGAHRSIGLAIRARALLDLHRPHEAFAAAQSAMELLESAGSLELGEALLRLTHAEALSAIGDSARAREVIASAQAWVLQKAAHIESSSWRQGFLERVPENRRILELARAWHLDDQGLKQD
jgi:tetratricopeptide (TPR) repeat protein